MSVDLLPYTPERDIYRLLQLEPEADTDEVISACRRLARTFHPDRNGSPRATEEMQVVNAVRRLMTDPQSRAAYDAGRRRYIAEHLERRAIGYRPYPAAPWPVGPGWVADSFGGRVRRAWHAAAPPPKPGRCPACAAPIEPAYRFCGGCGNRLLGIPLPPR